MVLLGACAGAVGLAKALYDDYKDIFEGGNVARTAGADGPKKQVREDENSIKGSLANI